MNAGCAGKTVHRIAHQVLRTRAIPDRLTGVFTMRRYTNPHLPLPYLTGVLSFFERRSRRSPNGTQPNFATCSELSQI